jgi:predicted DNA-binding protein
MTTEQTSFFLSTHTKRQLAQAARRLGRTETELVSEALADYLRKLEQPAFAFIGAGEDRGVTARSSEAWLRSSWKSARKK